MRLIQGSFEGRESKLNKRHLILAATVFFVLLPIGQKGLAASDEEKLTIGFTVIRGSNEGDKEYADKGIEKIASGLRKRSATRFKVYKIASKKRLTTEPGSSITFSFSTKSGGYRIELTPSLKGEGVALDTELIEKARPPRKEDKSIMKRKLTVEKGKSIIYVSLDESESMIFLVISVY